MRFLIIDNTANDRKLIERELKKEFVDSEFVEIAGPTDLEAAIAQAAFDVVLTEYQLPWADGFSILKTIKAKFPDVPVIMVTGTGHEEIAVEGMKLGLSDYVRKSQRQRLPPAVRESLEKLRLRRNRAEAIERLRVSEERYRLISEHKRAQDALRESEARYRTLAEHCAVGIWHITVTGYTIYLNRPMCSLLEVEGPEELAGQTYHAFFTPESLTRVEYEHAKRGQGLASNYAVEIVGKRGRRRSVVVSGAPLFSADGQLHSLIGTFIDVTEHKRAEEALQASEDRYHQLFENANDMIYTHDLAGNFTSINKAGERLTGYTREEVLRMNITQMVGPGYLKATRRLLDRHRGGEGMLTSNELGMMAKDGRRIELEVSVHPIYQDGKVVEVQGIARDVTERKRLEAQLRHAQKMESVGTLAGGVAHDFNNILTGIIGFAELALVGLSPRHPLYKNLWEIQRLGDRAAHLTRQLLTFARKQVMAPKPVNLNVILSDMGGFLNKLMGEHVELRVAEAPDLALLQGDVTQIEQVLMNLSINARDAMPQGGTLLIETRNVHLDTAFCQAHPGAAPGPYVQLSVSDTGVGFDRATEERIFDPFFTTKEPGQGTGLGLAIVYGIVQQHQGMIDVYSELGRGTTFKIYFPAAAASSVTTERPAPKSPRGGHETILVVEDEALVRDLILQILQAQGYRVLSAGNGDEAMRLVSENKEPIDLVLSDAMMPKRGGLELYQAVRRRHPALKFLLMSGYSAPDPKDDDRPGRLLDFLPKPFKPLDLTRKVRDILDRQEEKETEYT